MANRPDKPVLSPGFGATAREVRAFDVAWDLYFCYGDAKFPTHNH